MATTYLADDIVAGGQVAMKLVVSPEEPIYEALQQEFSLLTHVRHPNLVQVHDYGVCQLEDQGVCFYTCSYIDGQTLESFAHGRPWSELISAFGGVIDALSFLHTHRIRHGDFKPANILVTDAGRGVLIDLGCARPFGRTNQDLLSGTPGFIAPELLTNTVGDRSAEAVSIKADLYAVGVTLKELLQWVRQPPPSTIEELARSLCVEDPAQRPTSDQILELLGVDRFSHRFAVAPELVGRDEEMDRFRRLHDALWDDVPAPRVLWLCGPSGIGRSRLLKEMTWEAQLRGVVVEGLPSENEPVSSALQRSSGLQVLSQGLSGILEARQALGELTKPTVLVIDDAHRLDDEQGGLLAGLVRLAEPGDSLLLLVASEDTPPEGPGTVDTIKLGPLSEDAVQHWVEPHISRRNISQMMDLTGGFPALVENVLENIFSSGLREDRLGELIGKARVDLAPLEPFDNLRAPEKRVLALLAVKAGFIDAQTIELGGVHIPTLERLHQRGWIVPDGTGWKLRRAADAASLVEALDEEVLRTARVTVVEALRRELAHRTKDRTSSLGAQLAAALAEMGEIEEAAALVKAVDREGPHLRSWCRAADELAARSPTPDVVIAQAALHCDAGDADQALHHIARLHCSRPDDHWMLPLRLEAARGYLRLGDSRRCITQLRRAFPLAQSGTERAEVSDLMARCLIQRGEYSKALEHAQGELDDDSHPQLRGRLHEDVGVAASFLGDTDLARKHLALGESIQRSAGVSPRGRVRILSYQAINEYREGSTLEAAHAYERALDIAEKHCISDQIAQAALNLGTACHQLGDWGKALRCYERGLRTAVALGTESTTSIVHWNMTQLYLDIGATDMADKALLRVESDAPRLGSNLLVGAATCLRAVLQAREGRADWRTSASLPLERSSRLKEHFVKWPSSMSTVRNRSSLKVTRRARSRGLLASKREQTSSTLTTSELELLWSTAERFSQRVRSTKLSMSSSMHFDSLRGSQHRGLEGECETALSQGFTMSSAPYLAQRHTRRAREIWERMATALPAPLQDLFWSHPLRRETKERPDSAETGDLPDSIIRLFDIYRQTELLSENAGSASAHLGCCHRDYWSGTRVPHPSQREGAARGPHRPKHRQGAHRQVPPQIQQIDR